MLAGQGYRSRRQRSLAVLDVGTSKICCLIAKPTGPSGEQADYADAAQFQVVGLGHQQAHGMKGGCVVHMDLAEKAIAAAIDQAERMAGVTVDEVLLAVSCGRIRSEHFQASVDIATSAVETNDIERVLAAGHDYAMREGAVVLHAIPTAFRLDGGTPIADPRGMLADRFQADIHSVAVDEKPLQNLMLCVERCHVSIAGMVAAPYASALATATSDETNLGVTCIDFGAGTTTLSVFSEGQFIFADALAIGGNLITLDLARALSSPLGDAERMKILHASAFTTSSGERDAISFAMAGEGQEAPQFNRVTKAQIGEFVSPRMEEILEHIRHRLEASGLDAISGYPIVLTGGASQMPGLPELASRILGADARVGSPRRAAGLPEACLNPVFATGIGALSYSNFARRDQKLAAHMPYQGVEAGYLSRVGQWIRESF